MKKATILTRDLNLLTTKEKKQIVKSWDYTDIEWNRYRLYMYCDYSGVLLKDVRCNTQKNIN